MTLLTRKTSVRTSGSSSRIKDILHQLFLESLLKPTHEVLMKSLLAIQLFIMYRNFDLVCTLSGEVEEDELAEVRKGEGAGLLD